MKFNIYKSWRNGKKMAKSKKIDGNEIDITDRRATVFRGLVMVEEIFVDKIEIHHGIHIYGYESSSNGNRRMYQEWYCAPTVIIDDGKCINESCGNVKITRMPKKALTKKATKYERD